MYQKKPIKGRLDVILVERGLVESREQAKRLIIAGAVEVKGFNLPKPGQMVDSEIEILLKEKEKFVSRGGLKLEAALQGFEIVISDKVCLDIGASTGGFTDCMLQYGAREVYSVDVGVSQMHEKIKSNPRVRLVEHTNAKNLSVELFAAQPEFSAIDVSFISILRITEPLLPILAPGSSVVMLIKPQFEAGRKAVSKGRGIIRDAAVHKTVLTEVTDALIRQGWSLNGLMASPVIGGSGNKEFLCHARVPGPASPVGIMHIAIDDVI